MRLHAQYALVVIVIATACARPIQGAAQAVDSTLWCVNPGAEVLAFARSGNTLFLGGSFTGIGPSSGGGVPLGAANGAAVAVFPKVAGAVQAAVSDGHGGWFIGGDFVAVGGHPRMNLAHVTADGQVGSWAPATNGEVRCLYRSGEQIYVGGRFTAVNGIDRGCAAAVKVADGDLLEWNPNPSNWVAAILARGSTVFIGGAFDSIGGVRRPHIAAVDSSVGSVLPWFSDVDGTVLCIESRDSSLFIGGGFFQIDGAPRACIAALLVHTGELLPWDARLDRRPDFPYDGGPRVRDLLVRDSVLYVAGSFTEIGGVPRQGLAALNARTSLSTAWDPKTSRNFVTGAAFEALELIGDTLVVSGICDSIGGRPGTPLSGVDTMGLPRFS